MFLYSAVSSASDRSKRFKLHQLDFSGKHSSHATITRKDYSLTFPPLSVARYSFIQLSVLRHHGENENAKASKQQQR